eukprot:TRINITY_DN12119_c0_g1_i1.p1 TRINITY_DN12119_c0_g1~~TRINITY_DN12119_c0_g1_i1.p1  ORF type:complete len:1174 (+),score=298.62 TRINITY_DN12119_c0_g1_i1:44-3565(+)
MVGFEGHLRPRVPQDRVSSQFVSPPRNAAGTPYNAPTVSTLDVSDVCETSSPPWLTPQDTATQVMSQLQSHYRASSHSQTPKASRDSRLVAKMRSPTHSRPSPLLSSSRGLFIVNKAQQTALGRLAAAEEELRQLLSSEGINTRMLTDEAVDPERRIANAKAALKRLDVMKEPQQKKGPVPVPQPPSEPEEIPQEVCMLDFVSEGSRATLTDVNRVFDEPAGDTAHRPKRSHSSGSSGSRRVAVASRKPQKQQPNSEKEQGRSRAHTDRASGEPKQREPKPSVRMQSEDRRPPHTNRSQAADEVQRRRSPPQQEPQYYPPTDDAPCEFVSVSTDIAIALTPTEAAISPSTVPPTAPADTYDFPSKPSTCADQISQRASLMSVTFLDGTLPQEKCNHDLCTLRIVFEDPNESMGARWKYSNGCIVVDSLEKGGACDKAGLQKGWSVVSVNKAPVHTIQRLNKAVSDARCEQEWIDLGVFVPNVQNEVSTRKPSTADMGTECTTEVADASVTTECPYVNESDYTALVAQVEALQGAVNSALEERDALAGKARELETVREEYAMEQSKSAELQLLLDNCNEMLISHEKIADQCKKNQTDQDQMVSNLEDEKRKLEHQLKMSKHSAEEVLDKYELLQRKVQLLEEDLEAANARNASQKQHIEKLEEDISMSRKTESDVVRKLNSTKTDLDDAKDLVRQFQGNTELLVAENEEKRAALASVKQELSKVMRDNTELKRQYDKTVFQSNEQGIELMQTHEDIERKKLIISNLEAKLHEYEQRAIDDSRNVRSVMERNAMLEADISKLRSTTAADKLETVRRMESEADSKFSAMQEAHEREVGYRQQELKQMKEANTEVTEQMRTLETRVAVLLDEKQDLLSRIGALEMEQALQPSSPTASRGKRQSSRMSPLSASLLRGSGFGFTAFDELEPTTKSRQSVYFLDNVHPPDDASCSAVWTPVKLNVVASNYPALRYCTTSEFRKSSFARSRTASWTGGDLFMDRRISTQPVDGFLADTDVTQVTQTLAQTRFAVPPEATDAEAGTGSMPPDAPSPSDAQKVTVVHDAPETAPEVVTPRAPMTPLQETKVTLSEVLAICSDQRSQLTSSLSTLETLREETVSTRELLSRPEYAKEIDGTVWRALAEIEELYQTLKVTLDSYETRFDTNEAEAQELVALAASL